nr:MAG TPA: hypothetical protein [Caudoviricetes sp.]
MNTSRSSRTNLNGADFGRLFFYAFCGERVATVLRKLAVRLRNFLKLC